ncbi:MAG: hypothetical protein RMY64_37000 [Nostoc sp. DedQUE08]|uniref:hypothetical protein n=1 Tax=Nostoc sp. DedQUE08 TaxID=3075393 RepID=UPI002AD4C8D3|nr:hypothetical protein [Nostoc sp. DedQUE08]MDZ8071155.1 hypothetical protein [Nostoc sp. DedQUE08]
MSKTGIFERYSTRSPLSAASVKHFSQRKRVRAMPNDRLRVRPTAVNYACVKFALRRMKFGNGF